MTPISSSGCCGGGAGGRSLVPAAAAAAAAAAHRLVRGNLPLSVMLQTTDEVKLTYAAAALIPWRLNNTRQVEILMCIEVRRGVSFPVLHFLGGKRLYTEEEETPATTALREFAEECAGVLSADLLDQIRDKLAHGGTSTTSLTINTAGPVLWAQEGRYVLFPVHFPHDEDVQTKVHQLREADRVPVDCHTLDVVWVAAATAIAVAVATARNAVAPFTLPQPLYHFAAELLASPVLSRILTVPVCGV
eukprot:TRINITY_DN2796_c0_g1_i2.p1 TRINITY_DN2796_c0_g1~~TRINITY_DN2796_c0_g1_i2.p1  ORF type:complete len:247 (+),score=47.37 TRINITY_DN2796_c0_g1_i2:85-825(+)